MLWHNYYKNRRLWTEEAFGLEWNKHTLCSSDWFICHLCAHVGHFVFCRKLSLNFQSILHGAVFPKLAFQNNKQTFMFPRSHWWYLRCILDQFLQVFTSEPEWKFNFLQQQQRNDTTPSGVQKRCTMRIQINNTPTPREMRRDGPPAIHVVWNFE